MSAVFERLKAALPARGLVCTPNRDAASAALSRLRLAAPDCQIVDPYAALVGQFVPLGWSDLTAISGGVVDATAARPWDDPLWWSVVSARPGRLGDAVVLLPARFAQRLGLVVEDEAVDDPLASLVQRVLGADAPQDDDGPLLRRWVLESRSDGDERGTLVRLFGLARYERSWGRVSRRRDALEEAASLAERVGQPTEHAAALDALGDCLGQMDEVDAARDCYDRARAVGAAAPDVEAAWGDVVGALKRGHSDMATGNYRAAEETIEAAVVNAARWPAEQQARLWAQVAEVRLLRGRLPEAEQALNMVVALLDERLAAHPRRFDLRVERADARRRRGVLATSLDRRAAAREALALATDDLASALEREPAHRGWQAALAELAIAQGERFLGDGRLASADRSFAHAERVYGQLLEFDPDRVDRRAQLARVHRFRVYTATDPEAHLTRDTELTEQLLARRADDPTRRMASAQNQAAWGWFHEISGDRDAARAAWLRAAALSDDPETRAQIRSVPAFSRLAARCRQTLARLERVSGRADHAVD